MVGEGHRLTSPNHREGSTTLGNHPRTPMSTMPQLARSHQKNGTRPRRRRRRRRTSRHDQGRGPQRGTPAAPLTAFLVGYAAAHAGGGPAAVTRTWIAVRTMDATRFPEMSRPGCRDSQSSVPVCPARVPGPRGYPRALTGRREFRQPFGTARVAELCCGLEGDHLSRGQPIRFRCASCVRVQLMECFARGPVAAQTQASATAASVRNGRGTLSGCGSLCISARAFAWSPPIASAATRDRYGGDPHRLESGPGRPGFAEPASGAGEVAAGQRRRNAAASG